MICLMPLSEADALPTGFDRRLRLIVAGLGFWGSSWIPVVRRSPHWELVALVDTDPAALERSASAGGLEASACFDSIAAAARTVASDAILVAVPPAMHAPLALEGLENGLHCLIEKPFADTLADARTVVQRADSAGRIVMVSQQYRNRPGARAVARLIETGAVGRIGAVYVNFSDELAVPGFQHEMDEPLLFDMAIHHFDLMRAVLGLEPVRVQATTSNPSWSDFKGSAAASAVFETAAEVVVTYTGTLAPRGLKTGWDGVWDILCDDGAIHWHGDDVVIRPLARPFFAKVRRRVLGGEWRGRRVKPTPIDQADRLGSLAELAAAIREGREPDTSGRDNLRSLALVFAAIESARRRAAVEIADLG
jgi:predicted dehydrogenase